MSENDDARRRGRSHIPTMIQRAPSRDDITHEVVARITGAIRPWRIVLFGSRARGNAKAHSDYDFYVEVDAADRDALRDIDGQIHALFSGRGWALDFKLSLRGDFERRRDDPGAIEWDVAREGKTLYADPAASIEIPPSDRVREPSPEPPESLQEWLHVAERDLRLRDLLRNVVDDYSAQICWLSHQTCEKYLKALLVSRRVHPARTHKL